MKLNVHEIEDVAKSLRYEEPTAALNARLEHGGVVDFEFPENAMVQIDYYRAGSELFFQGRVEGDVTGYCARCLEAYPFRLNTDFHLVLVPKPQLPEEVELTQDELDLGYYEGEEIDLAPLVDEQIILALPTRPLCRESCRGLCPSCGINLNEASCQCASSTGDPRLAALRNLKLDH